MIQLYNYYRSSASFRVRIALNLKQLSYQDIAVNLIHNGGEQFTSEYLAINPQSLVPTLKIDDKIISQSLAIMEYLEELYPYPALLPSDAYQKAQVRAFALAIAADLHPLNNLRVLKYITNELGLSEEKKMAWYQHWIIIGLTALEKKITSQDQKNEFCFGDTPTLADVCLVPQIYNARRYSCDLTTFPNLVRIDASCQQHPAFQKAWPTDHNI